MQMNMMCARREFKNAQQRFDHMTMVIGSHYKNKEQLSLSADDQSYLKERNGNPFAVMYFFSRKIDATMAGAWLFDQDIKKFKKLAYVYSKLSVLNSVTRDDPMPFFFRSGYTNVKEPMFHMLMSDSTEIRNFLI